MASDPASGVSIQDVPSASSTEAAYISAMSRRSVVDAYTGWTEISSAEQRCLDLAFADGASLLDLGCGAGRFAMHLGHRCGDYLGVDASPEMITAARENCPELTFTVSDIVDVPIAEGSYDLVFLTGNVLDCLHPETRRAHMLARCVSWLRPEGVIVGSTHLTKTLGEPKGYYVEDYHGARIENFRASIGEIVDEAESCGFEVMLVTRDYRNATADWCCWVGRLV